MQVILILGGQGMSKKCFLCGGTEYIKRTGSVRDRKDLEIFECTSCGLVFLSSFEHIKEDFYTKSKWRSRETYNISIWLELSATNDERRFQYLKQSLVGHTLLDFGCGPGGFLLKARDLAIIAHGVELELRLSDYHKECGLTVFQNISDINRKYDFITIFHVLEHLVNPKVVIGNLCELLSDGGQIIIEVPNADDALLTLYQCEAFSNFTYWSPHVFLYTAKTLKLLFSQLNLKVNYVKQIQRYPLSNHLYWLAKGKSNGQEKWQFLDSPEMHIIYEKQLAVVGKCDTLLVSVSKR